MKNIPIESDEIAVLPCSQKLCFDTKTEASASANVVAWRYGTTVHPYTCDHCGLWHLSSVTSYHE